MSTIGMTERETMEATKALDDWFKSQQDIPPKYRAIIAAYWLASEIAIQGHTTERFEMGMKIIEGLFESKAREMRDILKKHGIS